MSPERGGGVGLVGGGQGGCEGKIEVFVKIQKKLGGSGRGSGWGVRVDVGVGVGVRGEGWVGGSG